jgi:predicted dehydrogenase
MVDHAARPTAALVGTGFIGPVHLEALRRLGVPVAGVLGSTPERGRLAAQQLGLPRAYASLAELLADASVQVVHITSPNRHHFAQVCACLDAGKHVVCEKPLAMTSAETAELVRRAAAVPQLVTAVNYNVRFYPLCQEARARLANDSLGAIHHVSGSYFQDWLLHETDFNWRVLAEEGGALRALADIGTHWLDLLHMITGLEVEQVCADLATCLPVRQRPIGSVETFQSGRAAAQATTPVAINTEDYGSVLLRFRGGARGVFSVSQVTAGRKNCLRWEVAAARGALHWNSERPNELHLGYRGRPNEILVRDPALLSSAAQPWADYPGGHNEGFPDSFKQLFKAIYAAIAGQGSQPYPTFADGHREVVLCEAILQSQREGRWIGV